MDIYSLRDRPSKKKKKRSFWRGARPIVLAGLAIGFTAVVVVAVCHFLPNLGSNNDEPTASTQSIADAPDDVMSANAERLTQEASQATLPLIVAPSRPTDPDTDHIIPPTAVPPPTSTVPAGAPMLVTPSPHRASLETADRQLLEVANSRITGDNSLDYRFNLNGGFNLVDQRINLRLRGSGGVTGLSSAGSINDVAFSMNADGEIIGTSQSQQFDFNFMLKNAILYQRAGSATTGVEAAWTSLALNDALASIAGIELAEIDDTGLSVPRINLDDLPDMQQFADLIKLGDFITTTRLADSGRSANFEVIVDLMAFLRSRQFADLLILLNDFGGTDQSGEMLEQDIEDLAAALPFLISQFLSDLSLSILETVDIDRQRVNEITIVFRLDLNAVALGLSTNWDDVVEITAELNVLFSNQGGMVIIEAPQNAIPLTDLEIIPAAGQ